MQLPSTVFWCTPHIWSGTCLYLLLSYQFLQLSVTEGMLLYKTTFTSDPVSPSFLAAFLHLHLLSCISTSFLFPSTKMVSTGQNSWHWCNTISLSSWQKDKITEDLTVILLGPEQTSESRITFDTHRSFRQSVSISRSMNVTQRFCPCQNQGNQS